MATPVELAKDPREIGLRVARRRLQKGLSQECLAEKLHMTRTSIGKLERGESMPRLFTLLALSKVLDVSPEWLLTGKRNECCSGVCIVLNFNRFD